MPARPPVRLETSTAMAMREAFTAFDTRKMVREMQAALDTTRLAREAFAALDTRKLAREMQAALDTTRLAREMFAALNTEEIARIAKASFRSRGVSASSTQAEILEMLPEVVSAIVEDGLDALWVDELNAEFTTYKLNEFLSLPMQMLLIAVAWFLTFGVVAIAAMSFPDVSTEVRAVTGSSAVWLADKASKFTQALLDKLVEEGGPTVPNDE